MKRYMKREERKTNCGQTEYIIRPGDQNVIVAKLNPVSVLDECLENNDAFCFAQFIEPIAWGNIKSVAVCSEMDEYNETLGKKIASVKIEQKYHKKMINSYNKILKKLDILKKYYSNKRENHCNMLNSANERLDKILKSLE